MSEDVIAEAPTGVTLVEAEMNETLQQWRAEDAVYWDADRDAWIVTGYQEAASILEDSKRFWRDISMRSGATEFWGRHLLMLEGRDHRHMHALHMKLTGEDFAEQIRDTAADIALNVSAALVERGKSELAADYADKVPFLIGCDFLGIDISDETLTDTLHAEMRTRGKWKEALHAGSGVPLSARVAQDGLAALHNMASALLPTIRARRDHPQDDLISAFWREGPQVFPDWAEQDVLSCCWSSLDNETKPLLRGLLYILCRDLGLQQQLRQHPDMISEYVEEGLRCLTPFRTMRRIAKQDVTINGNHIRTGDSLYLVTPLANRDESRWECPDSFSPTRPSNTTHLAFGLGPGYCVGRYVGRVEATEALRGILSASSCMELDPGSGENPRWTGEMYHSVSPIHALLR